MLDTEPTLRDLVQIYRRRKAIIYGITAVIVVATGLFCAFCTRRYEAVGTVNIQKQGLGDMSGLQDLLGGAGGGGGDASNPLEDNVEIGTNVTILQSDTLALRTIETLGLENTQDFQSHWNPFRWLVSIFSPDGGTPDPEGATLENAPRRRYKVLKVFAKRLDVKPVSGTRVIEIHYTNPDPKLAAAVVNSLTRALADYTFQTRYDATNQASGWLSGQLGDLRKQSEDLQGKVVQLERESGVYSLGTTDSQGKE